MIETEILYYSNFPFLRVSKGETVALRYRARSMVPIESRKPPVVALLVTTQADRTFVVFHATKIGYIMTIACSSI